MEQYIDQATRSYEGELPDFGQVNNTYYGPEQVSPVGWNSDYHEGDIIDLVGRLLRHEKAYQFSAGIKAIIVDCGETQYRYTLGEHETKADAKAREEAAKLTAREAEVDAIVAEGAEFLSYDFGGDSWIDTVKQNVGLEDADGTFIGFDIKDGFKCVLGLTAVLQHVNGYWGYVQRLRNMGVFDSVNEVSWCAEHGFVEGEKQYDCTDDSWVFPEGTASYSELQAAWERFLLAS